MNWKVKRRGKQREKITPRFKSENDNNKNNDYYKKNPVMTKKCVEW